MKWYYTIAGGHTHVRVFMNGAKCGDLCFRNVEFHLVLHRLEWKQLVRDGATQSNIEFINETPPE
jgi:hypothetical protein